MTKDKYSLVGAVVFIDIDTKRDYGYDEQIPTFPTLVYEYIGSSETFNDVMYYYKEDMTIDKYRPVYEYMIDRFYTFEDAQAEMPWLFL